jgi:DNA-binding CsgD family transcriptional regulator
MRKENPVEKHIDGLSRNHIERMGASHAGPGIMLLTASMQLLYKNQWASELCRKIIQCQDGKTANGVLPPAVAGLVDEICQILEVRPDPKDWEQIQVSRCVNMPHSSVLLCGAALVDQTTAGAQIVIVLSEVGIGAWEDNIFVKAKETFLLTARETTVVQHLLKGWSNKEIANEMRLAEQTVKEHFKHIADKTGATSRIGIVMKIIQLGLCHTPAIPSPPVATIPMNGIPIELVGSA